MGGFLSKNKKSQKSKDPRWQGIGPNTPLPSNSNRSNANDGYGRGIGSPSISSPVSNYSSRSPISSSQQLQSLTSLRSNDTSARSTTLPAAKKQKVKLFVKFDPKKHGGQRISKSLIGLPSDFRHTGHIGAGEVRSGQINPDLIRNQMMEVAACLKLDMDAPLPVIKTIPVQLEAGDQGMGQPLVADRYEVRGGVVAAH